MQAFFAAAVYFKGIPKELGTDRENDATATATRDKPPKPLPAPNSDFYELADVLTAEEKALVKKVRT